MGNLLDKARGQLLNIEQLIEEVESAQMQQEIFKAMQTGTELLQQINSEMDLDEVEQLMHDTAEAIAYQQELNDILSQNLTEVDDDAVLKALEAIEQMEADEMALGMADVPTKPIKSDIAEEEQMEEKEKTQKE